MDTKLTLRLDKEIKIYASKQQKSLSALTEELYKSFLLRTNKDSNSGISSPIARKYKGIISSDDFDADAQKLRCLKEKHLA